MPSSAAPAGTTGRPPVEALQALLHRVYLAVPEAGLRREDLRKASELAWLIPEAERALKGARPGDLVVDLACGKAYAGLAILSLLGPRDHDNRSALRFLGVESDPRRAEQSLRAMTALCIEGRILQADIASLELPPSPRLVVALHACGDATDHALDVATRARARWILSVPCCHRRLHKPAIDDFFLHRGLIAARWERDLQDLRRALLLESKGWQVETVEAFPAEVSPTNLLLRARLDPSPPRQERALRRLQSLDRLAGPSTLDRPE